MRTAAIPLVALCGFVAPCAAQSPVQLTESDRLSAADLRLARTLTLRFLRVYSEFQLGRLRFGVTRTDCTEDQDPLIALRVGRVDLRGGGRNQLVLLQLITFMSCGSVGCPIAIFERRRARTGAPEDDEPGAGRRGGRRRQSAAAEES